MASALKVVKSVGHIEEEVTVISKFLSTVNYHNTFTLSVCNGSIWHHLD